MIQADYVHCVVAFACCWPRHCTSALAALSAVLAASWVLEALIRNAGAVIEEVNRPVVWVVTL
jgi:hypothetical protein